MCSVLCLFTLIPLRMFFLGFVFVFPLFDLLSICRVGSVCVYLSISVCV